MFTGLIEDVGIFQKLEMRGRAGTLLVASHLPSNELALGESIAVNGVCLTIEEASQGAIRFHCLAETLNRTNLGSCRSGDRLNLERAVKLGGRLGGHIVTGHVDFCAKVMNLKSNGDDVELTLAVPEEQSRFFVEKGSVAVNGVSLTVTSVDFSRIHICLIPTTLAHTNLASLKTGSPVNIESDILGKYVLKSVSPASSVTLATLQAAGWAVTEIDN